ncbi:MAG: choice-of-anchor B family protein [Bacteroidota bacterium]
MRSTLLYLVCTLCSASSIFSQFQASSLGNWQDPDLVVNGTYNSRYNDVWGYANNGNEYAIIGSTEAIHIIDVTDPTAPSEEYRFAGAAAGHFVIHRDMKVFGDYLYCVADEGSTSTLQIIDMSNLPDTAMQVYNSNEFVVTCHNIFIDSSQARLYILGDNSRTTLLDISEPANPKFLATYPKPDFPLPYVHDAYIEDNIGYMNCANQGLWVCDFTDINNPVVLGTMDDYEEDGYNHSCWLSEDGDYLFMCDETHGSRMKVVNVTDPLDLYVETLFSPGFRDNEIPHNVAVKDGLLYVSHYYDGMQVFDVTNARNPIRVAEYDTYPDAAETWYSGNWGVYPYLPSGNILLSDMQYGLFVVEKLPDNVAAILDLKENEFSACGDEAIEFEMTVGSGFLDSGVTLETGATNLQADVSFTPNPAMPGEIVVVTMSNLNSTGNIFEEAIINASDGVNNASTSAFVEVNAGPVPVPANVSPYMEEALLSIDLFFAWDESSDANNYRLEISTDENSFEGNIIYTFETSGLSHTVDELPAGSDYFWRVVAIDECGETNSDVWAFFTVLVSVFELNGNSITVFPNPVNDFLRINFETTLYSEIQVELINASGQKIFKNKINTGEKEFMINMDEFLTGIYFLKIVDERKMISQKIIVY